MTANDLAVAHQLDAAWVAFTDRAEIGLLEIPVDPKRVGVDERDLALTDGDVVAELRQQVCHPAVDRRADLCALQIDASLVQIGDGLLVLCLRNQRVALEGLAIL